MEKKTISHYMRSLHRDIGFFVIGLTIIYAISGLVLMYRDTGLLKQEKQIERQIEPDVKEHELGMKLHIRGFEVTKTEGEIVYFKQGTYNKTTGVAKYTDKVLPGFIEKFNKLHRAPSKSFIHWASFILGFSLIFLAISSFWMYKPKSKSFRRGLILSGIGLVVSVILLFV